jgi:hypothetical protein
MRLMNSSDPVGIDKAKGLVPCGHCGNRRGVGSCRWCGRMICKDCLSNLDACRAPRTFVLPGGSRAVSVDREGRGLLYATPEGGCGRLDLRTSGRASSLDMATRAHARLEEENLRPWLRTLASGGLVHFLRYVDGTRIFLRLGVGWFDRRFLLVASEGALFPRDRMWVFCSDDETHAFAVLDSKVCVIPLFRKGEGRTIDVTHFPAAGAARTDGHLLCVGGASGIRLFDWEEGSSFAGADYPGTPLWIGLGRDTLFAIHRFNNGQTHLLRAPCDTTSPWRWHDIELACDVRGPTHASVTRDGDQLAVAGPGARVALLDGDGRWTDELEVAPSGSIDLVRFVDDDRRIVAAASGGEVVVWWRDAIPTG